MGDSRRDSLKNTMVIAVSRVVQILAGIVRSKAIALILGPVGMGLNGLYNSAINMISEFCVFGLGFSAVREIAGDRANAADTLKTVSSWLRMLAVIGLCATLVLAPVLSEWAFGDSSHAWGFRILSVAVFFNVMTQGMLAVLQGMREIKRLAYSSMAGALASIVIAVPLYWMMGDRGIPYAIAAASLAFFAIPAYHVSRLRLGKSSLRLREALKRGKEMMKLGGIQMATTLLAAASVFAVNSYISFAGSLFTLGLYQAGMSLTMQYSSMIFNSMASEYFPRLSSLRGEPQEMYRAVNDQIKNSLLMISPVAAAVMSLAPVIIWALLSSEFQSIRTFIIIMAVNVVVKGASVPVGYMSFAYGDKKTFFFLEGIFSNATVLAAGIIGFIIGGINGVACLTLALEVLYLMIVMVVARRRYGFRPDRSSLRNIIIALVLACATAVMLILPHPLLHYAGWTLSAVIVSIYGLKAYRLLRG